MLFGTSWLEGKISPLAIMGAKSMARRSRYDEDYDLFNYAQDYHSPSIVYMAVNKVNGNRYIGMTRQGFKRRCDQHIAAALRGKEGCSVFYRAIRKYGADAFEFSILRECKTYAEAAREEVRLIAEMKPEYNASSGGESVANVGFRPSPSAIKKGAETKKKNGTVTRYWLGKKRPDIAERQRARLTGRADLTKHLWSKAHTPEVRAKVSATMRSRPTPPKQLEAMARRRRKIICLDDGRIFIGSQAAADAIGCRQDAMLRVLAGKRPHVYGLRFQYVKDDDEGNET